MGMILHCSGAVLSPINRLGKGFTMWVHSSYMVTSCFKDCCNLTNVDVADG